jgi:hypothetical protein
VSNIVGQKVDLGQENGPDVELVVTGTELYATYETPAGYPAIYDQKLGLFCYARVRAGAYESTGVAVSSAVPSDVQKHARESESVRAAKVAEREQQMVSRSKKE